MGAVFDGSGTNFCLFSQTAERVELCLFDEPWDLGEGGYQVGNFPPVWTEWNGKYRDCVRDFWRGEDQTMGEFSARITGSSDLYENTSRLPYASINFITAHDGFTLNDLVSYNEKHNETNGEENQDGESHNRSWNCGVEGPTDNPDVRELRNRQKRNFLATLLLSQGVPMLLWGDEVGRTQQGNNNTYCQDNEISWCDWTNIDKELLDFCRMLIQYRKDHHVFHRRGWFQGRSIHGSEINDIAWFTMEGEQMTVENWEQGYAKSLGVILNGSTIPNPNPRGEPVIDDNFYIIFNAHHESLDFTIPCPEWGELWLREINTAVEELEKEEAFKPGNQIKVQSRSLVVLRHAS